MMSKPITTDPRLLDLLDRSAKSILAMTPAEREVMYAAQRRSWARGELAMGSDADEARWRDAGPEERARLAAELQARADRLVPRGTD